MQHIKTTIRFACPAFLGDANQVGAWRSPPFKAELRRWWRVAMAAAGHDLARIRQTEGRLFGTASQADASSRSLVRLRLSEWRTGRLTQWSPEETSRAMNVSAGGPPVAADLYLGFGRLEYVKGSSNSGLAGGKAAIGAGEAAELRVAWPANAPGADFLEPALGLMNRLGRVGGRNRNGWGSYGLDEVADVNLGDFAVDSRRAIEEHEWPRGIGRDGDGLLAWWTPVRKNWALVIRDLGQIRKDLCKDFYSDTTARVLLSYPVTKMNAVELDRHSARIPNSLCFKVVPAAGGGLRGLAFHMPCRLPNRLWTALPEGMRRRFPGVWEQVHGYFKARNDLEQVQR